MGVIVGVDIGGTNMVCGIVRDGAVISSRKIATEADRGAEHVLSRLADTIREIVEADGAGGELEAVGIGVPGLVDPKEGVVMRASNLQWSDVPIARIMSEKLGGVPVFADNDVKTYVYGEAVYGAGKGFGHVLGITVGTGIAAAYVQEGELLYGDKFMAGELGHIRMDGVTYKCGCGMTGCLESIASANGMARQAEEAIAQGRETVLKRWLDEGAIARVTAADVSKAYDLGDKVAVDIMNRTGTVLGKALSYAVTMLSPDCLVIGGGGALAGERLFKPLRETLKESVLSSYWDNLTIVPAEHNDHAGILGGAAFARQRTA
ncbi:ROK family protein [Paenibacillus thermotolerans]|uniref:ROK family protein n=1 Tax=Paenibacillus thermotolerans TaxID=3027807 RepID=UPI0023677BC5|nr:MULTISPECIES: ROK family protein [unclassified Paenibacillus]